MWRRVCSVRDLPRLIPVQTKMYVPLALRHSRIFLPRVSLFIVDLTINDTY